METAKPGMTQDSADRLSVSLSDITLRPLTLGDLDDYMLWATDIKLVPFGFEPCQSREEAINTIVDSILPHPWFRAICLQGRPIGSIEISENTGMDCCRGEISYVLGSQHWGKGIGTAAVKMAMAMVFVERPELERVEVLVDVENDGSRRVLEKAGFTEEGTLRKYFRHKGRTMDMQMFSFLSTDPLQH